MTTVVGPLLLNCRAECEWGDAQGFERDGTMRQEQTAHKVNSQGLPTKRSSRMSSASTERRERTGDPARGGPGECGGSTTVESCAVGVRNIMYIVGQICTTG